MPSISVRYFASIRERFGRSGDEVVAEGLRDAADIWRRVSSDAPPANLLVAINQEYATLDTAVKPGDEVAFFPPVTGG
jgi:molybdopterin synthase sulfur carrier subunit